MRNPRQKEAPAETEAYYHLVTRTVAGEYLFGDVEKELLRKHLWLVAERCGIEVISYAVMTNHLHVVVYAPKRVPLPDAELLRRYALLHSGCSKWEEQELQEIQEMLAADGDAHPHLLAHQPQRKTLLQVQPHRSELLLRRKPPTVLRLGLRPRLLGFYFCLFFHDNTP